MRSAPQSDVIAQARVIVRSAIAAGHLALEQADAFRRLALRSRPAEIRPVIEELFTAVHRGELVLDPEFPFHRLLP